MYGISAVTCGSGRIDIYYLEPGSEGGPTFVAATQQWTAATQWNASNYKLGGGPFATPPVAVTSHAPRPRPVPHPRPPGPPGPLPVKTPEAAESPEIGILPCRTDVFAVDETLAMRQLTLWNSVVPPNPVWANLGGVFLSAPGAVNWEGPRIDLFGVGTDYAMYRKVWNGQAWTADWERLGGAFSSAASIVKMTTGQIDVFARGSDNSLRHRAFTPTGPVNDWQNLGGSLATPPAAVSWGADRMDIFAVGPDTALWHRWWDGQIWNDWESLGGTLASAASAVSWEAERIDVFAQALSGEVVQFTYADESWTGPITVGGTNITSAPTAISIAAGQINAVAPSSDNKLHSALFEAGAWAADPFADFMVDQIGIPTRYKFSVDYVFCDTARSLNNDTDTAQGTVKPGIWPPQTMTQNIDSIGGTAPGQWQTNLINFEPIQVELCETASFNYVVINNGHADQLSLDSAMESIGSAIANKAIAALSGSGLLGAAAGVVIGFLGSYLFQDCDGLVAADDHAFTGYDLFEKVKSGAYDEVTQTYPGTDSPTGCGANSVYQVLWSVVRA
ncbi:MAG TPA: hypothetical protein VGF42_10160 [Caulobacteraceae bacterium]|jgi:hypothetical protein